VVAPVRWRRDHARSGSAGRGLCAAFMVAMSEQPGKRNFSLVFWAIAPTAKQVTAFK
jgi:hypothetical protein